MAWLVIWMTRRDSCGSRETVGRGASRVSMIGLKIEAQIRIFSEFDRVFSSGILPHVSKKKINFITKLISKETQKTLYNHFLYNCSLKASKRTDDKAV